MNKITLASTICLLMLSAIGQAQLPVPLGSSKELGEPTFTYAINEIDPTGRVIPCDLNNLRFTKAPGWKIQIEEFVNSSRTVDPNGKPKYMTFFTFDGKDPITPALADAPTFDPRVKVRKDAHLVSSICWVITHNAATLQTGNGQLRISHRLITVGRQRDIIVTPQRGNDIEEDRITCIPYMGVEYYGPADYLSVLTFETLRSQEMMRTGHYRSSWLDELDEVQLENAVKAIKAEAAAAKASSPEEIAKAKAEADRLVREAAEKAGKKEAQQPPEIPASYGQVDPDVCTVMFNAYDRDIIVECNDPGIIPFTLKLAKGEAHGKCFKKINATVRDRLKFNIKDAATGEIVETIHYKEEK